MDFHIQRLFVLCIQNLNGLHDDFHTGTRPPMKAVGTISSPIICNLNADFT